MRLVMLRAPAWVLPRDAALTYPRRRADTLLLAANELGTNAVLHARTELAVRAVVDPTHVRVEVTDDNNGLPHLALH